MELKENKLSDLVKSIKSKLADIYNKVLRGIIGMPDARIDRLSAILRAKDSEVLFRSGKTLNPNAASLLSDYGLDVSSDVDSIISFALAGAVLNAWVDAQLTLCVPALKKLAAKRPGVADQLRLEVFSLLPNAIIEKANALYDVISSAPADGTASVMVVNRKDGKRAVDGDKVKVKDLLSRIDDLGGRSAFAEIAVSLAHSVGDLPDLSEDPDVLAAY